MKLHLDTKDAHEQLDALITKAEAYRNLHTRAGNELAKALDEQIAKRISRGSSRIPGALRKLKK